LRKYHYVRWRWENLIDVDSLAEELSEDYKIKDIKRIVEGIEGGVYVEGIYPDGLIAYYAFGM
jgi:hypothetical protein